MFTATGEIPRGRGSRFSLALSLMKFFFMESTGRNSSAGQQWMAAWPAGEWRKQRGKGEEREDDFAEECHSGITFMNCCSTLPIGEMTTES